MNIIHILPNLEPINYGVWNVVLKSSVNITDESVITKIYSLQKPKILMDELESVNDLLVFLSHKEVVESIKSNYDSTNTVIVSHGNWTKATLLGATLAKSGYRWVVYPHGMLEPWALGHKAIKKKIYFLLLEKRWLGHADLIIAVGKPELQNLKRIFKNQRLCHIPNGVNIPSEANTNYRKPVIFCFMARLHKKKGVVPLVKAWSISNLRNDDRFVLKIAGPDEGELEKVKTLSKEMNNVHVLGGVYGDEKENILKEAAYFVLPSYSEGFPTSIIEAMSYGCVPVITEGCNFPEVFRQNLAFKITTNHQNIKASLEQLAKSSIEQFLENSKRSFNFVKENYSIKKIATKQINVFSELLKSEN